MSGTGISILYKSRSNDIGHFLLRLGAASFLLGMALLFYHILQWHHNDYPGRLLLISILQTLGLTADYDGSLVVFAYSALLLLSPIVGSIGFWLIDSRVSVNADLIRFPFSSFFSMLGRRERLWSDVQQITVHDKGSSPIGKLVMYFKSGGNAVIDLRLIEPAELEKLLLSLETRATQAAKSFEFEVLLDYVHNQKISNGEVSFTKIWEEDMNRHFSAVTFIPQDPGSTLQDGKFKILRQLSFGGFSAVYLAQCGSNVVILKEAVTPSNIGDLEKTKAEEMLRKEASLLLNLSHPQIVRVQDYFVEEGKSYLVLEYLTGENLRQFVKRNGPLEEDVVLKLAHQLAAILVYLHSQDPPVIHRDISPDNIIVNDEGTIALIDFGAANEFLSNATGTVVGKQSYIPPEQFKGKTVPKSDLYGFGATMYFLLTGHDPEPLSQSHAQSDNIDVSDSFDQLIASCTNLDLEMRLGSAEELMRSLEAGNVQDGIRIQWKKKQLS